MIIKTMLLVALLALGLGQVASATTSVSPNYQVSETEFGSGGTIGSCSGNYCASASIGDMVSGESSSPSYSAKFSKIAIDSQPLLEVIVDEGQSDLGVLSMEKTSHKTSTVKIRTYMSDGYTLQIIGDPPKYQGHSLQTPATPVASKPGSEQFALNLMANTIPQVGANPVQSPSADFSYGQVTADYAATNLFKYQSGEVVARSDSQSGQTDYTISMIINVADSTPAGHYNGAYQAVVIPAF